MKTSTLLRTLSVCPLLFASLLACSSSPSQKQTAAVPAQSAGPSVPPPSMAETTPRDYPGIHNAVAYHPDVISGSVPEGDAGFDTLAAMGIKTIISVDGAVPDVEAAKARGIRYIHLPIGYNGFDEKRKLELVRATRDAMAIGPVYMHCHHGKHRSAGAAAAVGASLGWATPTAMIDRMKVSGTAPGYKGLYACAANAAVVSMGVIDAVPAEFPEVSRPAGFVKAMVEIDEVTEHLRAIEKAGWTAPADQTDLIPAAEAGRLSDLLRTSQQTRYVENKPDDFLTLLKQNESQVQEIEDALAQGSTDAKWLSAKFAEVNATCKACHVKYRD